VNLSQNFETHRLAVGVKIYGKSIGGFCEFFVFYVRYSTLLHLQPFRFHSAGGCWDRTQDCDFGIDNQTLQSPRLDLIHTRLDLIHTWLGLVRTWLDLIHEYL
jgi:hypothetical protein